MKNPHNILLQIPHVSITQPQEEHFELFKLGTFTVDVPLLKINSEIPSSKSIEEIVELVKLQAHTHYQPHYHELSSAILYMILGEGTLILGDEHCLYQPGLRFLIPAKMPHGFITQSTTLFLSIQSPPIHNQEKDTVDIHYGL
ncbi:MAG: hypothetical protein BGO90_01170 [Legionella sp. 40-6]|nr:cupin domain-containing protein [Legionella sp.]OJY37614.1 MAG: hypothetical protein BGO90_01170 [Legionella sp. 40-6]